MSRFFVCLSIFGGLLTFNSVAPGKTAADSFASYRIAVLHDVLPGHQPNLGANLARMLSLNGYPVRVLSAEHLENPSLLNGENFDLLVLPTANALPWKSTTQIQEFMQAGGDILALDAPAFTHPLWRSGTQWMSIESWREQLAAMPTQRMLFDFDNDDLNQWVRHTNTPDHPVVHETVPGPYGNALHVHIENMEGWDGFAAPDLQSPIPADHQLIAFYAKGAPETRTLSLECVETDGSRWIASFPVIPEWQRITLTPHEFGFWESIPGRGQEGDVLNFQAIRQIKFGISYSHTGLRGGEYEYWVDQVGTLPNPWGEPPKSFHRPPVFEGLSPGYKFYPMQDVTQITSRNPWLVPAAELPVPAQMSAHYPRPTGNGFEKGRGWRWIPLMDALGPNGEWRGAPAVLYAYFDGDTQGSIRAAFSISDTAWYNEPIALDFVMRIVERMAKGIYFEEAGSEFYTYRENESVIIGARIANLSTYAQDEIKLQFLLRDKGQDDFKTCYETPLTLPAGEVRAVSTSIQLPSNNNQFDLEVRLYQGGELLDQTNQELAVYKPKPENRRQYMTAHDGDFYLDGKKWYAHGVNYMPSTGLGIGGLGYFEYWLGKTAYDPEFIQRDLERCKAMGLNCVSIFIHYPSVQSNNLLDILRRCEELGLMVNLSIRPGTPMEYHWEWWEEIIRHYRLWEFDNIFTYDIAWEPFFGTENQRRKYDPEWKAWIEEHYGSIEQAEAAWSYPAPRFEENISTPTQEHFAEDGPQWKLVADYRRFVDELIHSRYQEAAERIQEIDPHHLISFRMTVTGDPTFDGSNNMPYDFKGVAQSMDIMEPEGYGRIGSWERVKHGRFTVDYARFCAPGKPVLWAEAGVSAWDQQQMRSDPERLEFQGAYFADFYKMVLDSYSNGIIWWWYPGGYRLNERSDFGIINPDGTPRPATETIKRFAEKVLSERTIPTPDVQFEFDRDGDARGLFGVYESLEERYWEAIENGKHPGLIAPQK